MRFPRRGWSAAAVAVICATGTVWAVPAAAVAAGPQAELSIEPAPAPLSVTFVASAADFKPISYVFQFGDGHTVKTTSPTVVHTYAKPGHFAPRVTETGAAAVDSTITAAGTLNVDRCAAGSSCTENLQNVGSVIKLGITGPIEPNMAAGVNLFVGPSQIKNCETAVDTNGGVTDSGFTGNLTLTAAYHVTTLSGVGTTCFSSTVPFTNTGGMLTTSGKLPHCSGATPTPPCVKSIVTKKLASGWQVTKTLLIPPGDPTVGSL
jgi:hypothetical protein